MKTLSSRRSFLSALIISTLMTVQSTAHANTCNAELETLASVFMDSKADGSKWSQTTRIQTLSLSLYPERNRISEVRNRSNVDIPFVIAHPSAPLVFVQSGLGGNGQSGYNFLLMGILSRAGFNVVSVPSQYFWRMSLASSSNLRPGYKQNDLQQLMTVYQHLRTRLEQQRLITRGTINHFVGVSNGGYNGIQLANTPGYSAFFQRYVVINPPLDLMYGIQTLDRDFSYGRANIPSQRYDMLMGYMIDLISRTRVNLNAVAVDLQRTTSREELRYVISRQLVEGVQEAAVVSQLSEDQNVFRRTRMTDRLSEARRWTFQNYQNRILTPYYEQRNVPASLLTRNTNVINDLRAIARQRNLLLLHSSNDFISNPSDIALAKRILRSNAVIADCGGHVGALTSAQFQEAILQFLR